MISIINPSLRNNCRYIIYLHIISIITLVLFSFFLIIVNQTSIASFASNNINTDCLDYDSKINVITLYCYSTFSDVASMIDDKSIIKREDGERGTWLLNSSLNIDDRATLVINFKDGVEWLKIISPSKAIKRYDDRTHNTDSKKIFEEKNAEPSISVTPNKIKVFGKLEIEGVKITSWDPITNYYAFETIDGKIPRPYIMINEKANALNITNSEIAYLGYNGSRSQGINMYGGDGSIIRDSKIHDLWYGFYSDHTGHMIIKNNTIYNNIKYGLDPHSRSHDMIIRNNLIVNNSAGLVCSYLCINILFENNQIYDNKKIGILFSKNVSNSIIRYNNITESEVGVGISRSHNNQIYDNTITNSDFGLKLKTFSSNNIIKNNKMTNSINCDIALTSNVENNIITSNHLTNPKKDAICLTKDELYHSSKDFVLNIKGIRDIVFNKNIIQQ